MKKYIKSFLKEIIPVIAGILIALWINNWNEERKDRAYLEKTYSRIEKELRATEKEIQEIVPKQQRFLDILDTNINNNKFSFFDIAIKADGVYSPRTKLNSWKAMSNSKIELLDYDKMILLSDIEDTGGSITNRVLKINEFILANANETSKTKKELLKFFIIDLMNATKRLQQGIDKILNE